MRNTDARGERAYIRELATKVAEFASSPDNGLVCQRWRDVNALRKPDRYPVWCRPVGAWEELLPDASLQCKDPWLCGIERDFRRVIMKHEIEDDSPIDPGFPVGAIFDVTPANFWGISTQKRRPGGSGGAWAYNPPLKTAEDFAKLQRPRFAVNKAKTELALAKAHELLGDILPVRLVCGPPLSATLGTAAADLRGLNQMMLDMAEAPELMHHLMTHLRDATIQGMRDVEATGLLTPNNTGPMTSSDPIAPQTEETGYKNLWAMANSQEFDRVSPAMWNEFCLNYQRPILAEYGLVGYGCCEDLTHKIDGVLSIPNLRIFVCSAWTDLDHVIDRVGSRHTIMWRQKASDVVFPDDTKIVLRALEGGLRRLKGCYVQIVLRELQTLAGHPDRLHVWTRYAKDMAAKYV